MVCLSAVRKKINVANLQIEESVKLTTLLLDLYKVMTFNMKTPQGNSWIKILQ